MGELGLIVIDDLPVMIEWVKGRRRLIIITLFPPKKENSKNFPKNFCRTPKPQTSNNDDNNYNDNVNCHFSSFSSTFSNTNNIGISTFIAERILPHHPDSEKFRGYSFQPHCSPQFH